MEISRDKINSGYVRFRVAAEQMKTLHGGSWAALRRLDCPGYAVHAYASRASCDYAGMWMATFWSSECSTAIMLALRSLPYT